MPIYSKTPGSLPPSDKFTRKRSLKTLISEQSLLALEPRMLLDAATVATVTDALVPVPDDLSALHIGSNADAELLAALADLEAPVQAAPAAPAERSVGTLTLNALLDGADSAAGSSRSEIVFIDSSVPDYEDLIAAARDGMEIVVLDGSRDGLTQIAEYLDGRTDVDAIHILSHGSAGEKVIGSTVLTADNLNQFSEVLGQIGASLSDDGDILLYGCSVADEQGTFLVDEIARLTGADVAASDDTTANAAQGGDWVLEYQSGRVEADLPFADEGLAAFSSVLDAQVNLSGKDGWVSVMSGASFDPKDDSQAGSADLDIVGSDAHGVLYTAYDDNGTSDTADDYVAYRVRLNNADSTSDFSRVLLIGVDANADGRIDLFFSIDGRNNSRAVKLFDPGTGLNNSPSTTTTSPLPSGWLSNNGVYPMTSSNFSVVPVSSTTDPHWSGDNDLGDDGKTDAFVNFKLPVKDIATVLAIGSPTDRNGVIGPRGTDGIDGFTKNTSVRYVLLSQTQPGPINGDLAGVGKTYDKNATFADLGAMTATMTLSDPLAVGSVVQVGSVGDGNLSSSESSSVLISGTVGKTVANASWVKITVTDTSNASVVYYVQTTAVTNAEGTWSKTAADLSSLASGTLTVTAELWSTGDGTGSKVSGSSSGLLTATLDKTAPAVAVTSTSTKGTPTISGTSDLPVGSQITVVIDPDNNDSTSNSITYLTTVLTGGTWSIPVGVATPSSGTLPTNGLTSYAKITVSGTDAAGNTTSVNALNKPTVNSVTTTDTTPDLSGTWTNISGDTLTVTVNGVEYGTSNGLTISSNRWTLTVPTALSVATHNVTAKVTRSGTNAEDATTGELVIVSGQTVTITSSATTDSARPTLTGGSTLRDGSAVLVRVDTGNDGLSYITYSVTTNATTGEWSLNLSSATPISGTFPTAGLSSSNGILVSYTDTNGTVSASQTLTYTAPTVTVSTITSAETAGGTTSVISNSGTGADYLNKMEAPKTVISGTTTAANGTTINLRVVDDNFNVVTGTATVSSGAWTSAQLDLSALDNGTLTVTATINGTTVSGTKTVTHDKTAPRIFTLNQASVARDNPTISGISELVSQTVAINATDDKGTVISGTTTTDASGNWSFSTTNDFANQANTVTIKVSSTATDTAGNYALTSTTTHSVAPGNSGDNSTISINSVTADNIVVTDEVASGVSITGTTSVTGATAGTATGNLNVTVTDGNGVTVTPAAQVNSTGKWLATLSNAQVQTLANGQLTVMATIVGSVTTYKLSSLSLDSPVLTITDNVTSTADGNVTFTFKFDQNVTGFGGDASDIVVTGGTEGSVTTVSASEYTMTVTPTANSSGDITVTVPAAAGKGTTTGRNNVGSSATQAYNTNAGVVAAPDITISIANQATNAFPTISGTTNLSAGANIEVTIDPNGDGTLTDAVVYDAVVKTGSPNTWTINTESATPRSGTVPVLGFSSATTMTAKATNAYGNSTELVGSVVKTITTDSGSSSSDFITNDDTLSFSGYAKPSTTVDVYVDATKIGSPTSNSSGVWTVDYTGTAISAGEHTLKAVTTVSGDTATSTQTVTIDKTAPTVTISTITDDTGTASDWITKDNQLTFAGTATANAPVKVSLSGTSGSVFEVTVVADGSGNWTVNRTAATALPDGTYTLTASSTDSAGNTTAPTKSLTVDTSAALTITSDYKTKDTTPVISGTTDIEVGRTITIGISPTNNGTYSQTYTTTVQTGGTWSVEATTALSNGTIGVRATGTDLAGNEVTATKTMVIDTSAPTIAVTTPLDGTGGNGTLDSTEDGAVVIKGTTTDIPVGSTLTITITDGTTTITDTTTVQTGGTWQLSALNLKSMANGTLTVNASYTDSDGVQYVSRATVQHSKSTAVSIDSITNDTGTLFDYITSDQTLVFKGSATATNVITVTLKNSSDVQVFSGTATANSSGIWTYDYSATTLNAGTYTLSAVNGGTTATQTVTIDTTAPAGPVTVATLSTEDTTPAITGTATVGTGETLTVAVNGVTYTAGDGKLTLTGTNWTLNIPDANALTVGVAGSSTFDGKYEVKASIRDTAGNVLSDSTTKELAIQDTTAPSAPGATLTSDTGSSGSDKVTKTGTVTVSSIESGATWQYSTNGGTSWTTGTGTTFTLAAGTYAADAVRVRQTDAGSNVSAETKLAAITVDQTNPATPTLALASDTGSSGTDKITSNGQINVTGIETNASWQYTTDGGTNWSTGTGSSFTLAAGTYTDGKVLVRQTDLAGNTGSNASLGAITVDGTAPTAPTVTSLTANSTTPTLTGTATVGIGETLTVVVSGATYTVTPSGGNWSLNLATATPSSGTLTALTNGSTYSVTATVTDTAGNATSDTTSSELVIDTTAPAAPGATLTTDSGSSGTDKVTNTGTVTVSSIESGATWQYSTNGGTSWSTGTGTSFTLAAGTYAADAVRVRQTDAAGNVSAETKLAAITVDQTNPAAPTLALASDTGSSGTDKITSNGQINVTGIETNASWQYTTDGGTNWSTGTGSSFTLAAGTYTDGKVLVRQTDLAGNTGSNASLGAITVDGTAPTAPTVTSLTANSTTPTLTGTATVGSGETLTVVVSGATYTVTPSGGNWSLNLATATPSSGTLTALTNGSTYSVTATVTDTAGNATSDTTSSELVIDTTAPAAPGATLTSDTGSSGTDKVTNTGTVTVSSIESGATWQYSTNGGTSWSTGTGTSFTLAAGTYAADAVRVRQTDAAGNVSAETKLAAITVDQTNPAAPTLALASDTGTSTTDKITSNGQINVTGLETSATWQYTTDGGTTWSTGTGSSFTLSAGTYTDGKVLVRQTDLAGNTGSNASLGAITVDGTAPTAPTVTTQTSSSATPTLAGTATVNSGETLKVTVSGATYTVTPSGGNWSLNLASATPSSGTLTALTNGTYSVIATVTDAAGNSTSDTTSSELTINTSAPSSPTVTSRTTNDTTPTVTGTATVATGETLTVEVNGVTYSVGTDLTHNSSSNTWSLTIPNGSALSAGTYSVIAKVTNSAGTSTSDSTSSELVIDTTAPAAPSATLTSDTGSSGTDKVTNTGTVTVSSIESGATWQYSTDGGTSWSTGTGTSFTLSAGTYAADAVRVRQTDAAGNVSAETKLAAITVDQTNPAAPTLALASDTGSSNTDKITSNGQINVTGIETNATWQYSTDGGTTWSTGTGSSFTLAAGTYTDGKVLVRQTDLAGNTGSNASLGAITVDGTAPAAPTVTSLTANSTTPTLTGTATVGSGETLKVTVSGATYTVTPSGGNWSLNLASATPSSGTLTALTNGSTYSVTATVTDAAGNAASDSTSNELVINTSAPAAPGAALGTDSGSSGTDAVTKTGTVTVSLIESGATWQYSTNGGTSWTTGTGTSFTLTEASYAADAVRVRQTNSTGTTSAETKMGAIVVDQTNPAAPTLALASDTGSSSTDKITSNGQINVTGIETNASWQYTTDGGTTWSTGTGSSFTLAAGTYTDGKVLVRQTDLAGNTGSNASLGAITVDGTAPAAPTVTSLTTSSTTPTLTGTATVGSGETLKVTVSGATYTVTPSGGNWSLNLATATPSSGTLTALTSGTYSVTATVTDTAGNSTSDSTASELVVNTGAPSAPTVTSLTTNSTTPTLTGTATLGTGETLKVTVSGATYTVTPSGGNWSLNLASATPSSGTLTALTNGTYSVTATVTNSVGTSTSDTTSSELVINTSAPAAPGVSLGTDSGSSGTDAVTKTGTVNVTSLESGATWQYSTNGGTSWTTGTGTSFTLTAGTYAADAVRVRQTNSTGTTSAETKMGAITVDQTNPAAPTLALASDTGTSTTDKITSNGQINVTGIETNATWQYTADGGTTWSTGTGSSFTLSAGTYTDGKVLVRQTDLAGNTGSNASLGAITVDSTAPTAPTVTTQTSTSTTPTLAGTATVGTGETLKVTVSGATYTVTPSGGNWTLNLGTATPSSGTLTALSNGTYSVTATVTDTAGNSTSDTTNSELTINTGAPSAPTVNTLTTGSTTPTITGTATLGTGETLKVTVSGATYTVTPSGGNWSLNLATATPTSGTLTALTDGTYPVTATVTNSVGTATSDTTNNELVIDTTAPAVPGAALTTDSGSSGTDKVTNTGTVTVSSIEGGATWQYSTNGGTSWTTGTGTSFSLAAGTYAADAVRVRQSDASGNVSAETKLAAVTVDQTNPAAPTLALAADTGTSNTDKITSNGQINVTGIETNASWQYTTDGGTTWNTGTGSSFTLAAGTYADGKVLVRQTDLAGNTGSNASLGAITVDGGAPTAPTVSSLTTNSTTPTLTGTATLATGETLKVTVSGATYNVTPSGGNWSLNLATATPSSGTLTALTNGSYSVTATVTNSAGNSTSDTTSSELVIDTTAPAAPTVATLTTNSTTPTLTGTATLGSGETLKVTVSGATYTVTPSGGNWSLNLATATPSSAASPL